MSFESGFAAGAGAVLDWKKLKQQKELEGKRIDFEANMKKADLDAAERRQKLQIDFEKEAQQSGFAHQTSERVATQGWQSGEHAADRQSRGDLLDKELQGGMAKMLAQRAIDQPLVAAQIGELNARRAAYNAKAEPNTAEVEQLLDPNNPNGGKVRFRAPMSAVAGMTSRGEPQPSPFAAEMADAQKQIQDNEAQIAAGDNRTGFLNMSSRKGIIDEQSKRLMRLRALDLKDKVEKGIISQQEADRLAKQYLPQ